MISLRTTAAISVFLGISLSVSMTALSWSRSMAAFQEVEDKQRLLLNSGEPLTRSAKGSIYLFPIEDSIQDWNAFTYDPLALTAIAALWLVFAPVALRPDRRGMCVRCALRASMTSALICGSAFGLVMWSRHEYRTEVKDLIYVESALCLIADFAALFGAAAGAVFGLIWFQLRRAKTTRQAKRASAVANRIPESQRATGQQ
jgi:hypothetical protein